MNETITTIITYLDKISMKLGQGAGYFWPFLVRQQCVRSIYSLVTLLIFASGFLIFLSRSTKTYKKDAEGFYPVYIWTVAFGLGFFIFSLVFLRYFYHIFNPEYWALMDLIRKLKY